MQSEIAPALHLLDEECNQQPNSVEVLLADSRPMESQLLVDALRARGFRVVVCGAEAGAILQCLEQHSAEVLVMSAGPSLPPGSPLRTVHLAAPEIYKIALLESERRESVVQAFRSGARGIFCLSDASFQSLCECIEKVRGGGVWASQRQLGYLLDSICQVPALQVLTACGEKLLTSREEQVVALVADGLSNRNIASELGLSEHTVKKYLFSIFDKLGISNRVELVLYAVRNGSPAHSQWVASA